MLIIASKQSYKKLYVIKTQILNSLGNTNILILRNRINYIGLNINKKNNSESKYKLFEY